jgi:hypothetical protein
VHALLRHLEDAGFDGAPHVVGTDSDGREVLSFIEGFVPYAPDIPDEIWSDSALLAMAHLVRRYHDAVRSFDPPRDAVWRFCPGAPRSGDVICHNDLGPWNTVFRSGLPRAVIDWDFAAPAPALWDVAYAAWRFVPLYWDGIPGAGGAADVGECARRLRLFCDGYGLTERHLLLDTVQARQQVMYETVRHWGEAGVPGFVEMWNTGHATLPLRDQVFVGESRDRLASAL